MRIGIDIDGVLTNIDQFLFDYYAKFLFDNNVDFSFSKFDYDTNKVFGVTEKIEDDFWDKYLDFYARTEKARPFAAEVIKKLKNDGHEIFIVTKRYACDRDDKTGKKARKTVTNWLKKNDIYYDKIVFCKSSYKVDEIIQNNIDIMIDDNPKNIESVANIIPVLEFVASYNFEVSGPNIIKCLSWYDIYNKIKSLKRK